MSSLISPTFLGPKRAERGDVLEKPFECGKLTAALLVRRSEHACTSELLVRHDVGLPIHLRIAVRGNVTEASIEKASAKLTWITNFKRRPANKQHAKRAE